MKKKDGLNLSDQFLEQNGIKLKQIATEPSKGRVINLPMGISFGAVAAAILTIVVIRLQQPNETDLFANVTSDELIEYYESGRIDVETDMLLEYTTIDDFSMEINPNENEIDILLDDLNDEELYKLLN
ncbi:MAG: hypothetical protein HWE14_03885 [Flavobacteriia bacterium]|nr:hypothetical protein [Flavobacteriia bacterium]